MSKYLTAPEIRRALDLRDLTDVRQGPHAMQQIIEEMTAALCAQWSCRLIEHRESPIVSVGDNYDRLHYPSDGVARDARYTRYLNARTVLRTQTSAVIPRLLETLEDVDDVLLVCPGLVYRRDTIDRIHTGEPHQLDLWRIRRGPPLDNADLVEMIGLVIQAVLPRWRWRTEPAEHPYTVDGLQVDVVGDERVEVGECGLASPDILAECGLDDDVSGLAMGLGLDRLLMLRKSIPDIRLLRSHDARIADQMLDLAPYREVSRQPAVTRDLSVAVPADDEVEDLGDRVRTALGADAAAVESVELLDTTTYEELPPAARERLGMRADQKNVLVRVVLRHVERALTREEANELRNQIYAALHGGDVDVWA